MGLKLCVEPGCMRSTMGTRCAECEAMKQARRNADPKRRAYRDPGYRAIPLAGACACCGSTSDLTRDHVVPLVAGDSGIVQLMCRPCNGSKGGRRLVDTTCPMHGGLVWGVDGGGPDSRGGDPLSAGRWRVLSSYSERRYDRGTVGHVVIRSDGLWAAMLDGEHVGAFDDDADARDHVDRVYARGVSRAGLRGVPGE